MYKLTDSAIVIRQSDKAFIPANEENLDYQEFLDWLAQGNTPEPYTPVSPPK